MMCRGNLSPHAVPMAIECCRVGDQCNKLLYPMYDLTKHRAEGEVVGDGGDPNPGISPVEVSTVSSSS